MKKVVLICTVFLCLVVLYGYDTIKGYLKLSDQITILVFKSEVPSNSGVESFDVLDSLRRPKKKYMLHPNGVISSLKSNQSIDNYTLFQWNLEGKLISIAEFKANKRHGLTREWNTDGVVIKAVDFIDGKYDGEGLYYYDNGALLERGNYKEGKKVGTWKYYDKKGYLLKSTKF